MINQTPVMKVPTPQQQQQLPVQHQQERKELTFVDYLHESGTSDDSSQESSNSIDKVLGWDN
jgi:hypothetical protein